ncbi:MAG: winged helix-turn-helix domain-containing protein, partial [Anaerolineae bacterium]|nr:winged helix-turn-helix domain-containing protein [Anaerolineae bacterium]
MHILIFAPTPGMAEELHMVLDNSAHHYTLAVNWGEVLSSVGNESPDLILIERASLARMELNALLDITEAEHWPPVLLVDKLTDVEDEMSLALHLATQPPMPRYYQIGELRVDTRRKRVAIGERWVTLPPIQYRLLLALASRPGEVVTYQELLRAVWGYDGEDNEARELLKVHIRQIRRRLGLEPEQPTYIHSVRGLSLIHI